MGMIHNLRCQLTGVVLGTIDLPADMPADEVLRRTYTQSGVIAEGVVLPTPVPETATPATIRIALRRLHGISTAQLDATVNAIIGSISNPNEQEDARDLWNYAVDIERTHLLVEAVGQSLNLSSTDIDNVFRVAKTI